MSESSGKWKWGVALLLVCVGALITYRFFAAQPAPLSNRVTFVCIETGKEFRLGRDAIPSILPAANPSTGRRTLLPIQAGPDGEGRFIRERYRDVLSDPEIKELNQYVDHQTFAVRAP